MLVENRTEILSKN